MEQLLRFFIQEGTRWVQKQRNKHRLTGRQLEAEERRQLTPFFHEDTLNTIVLDIVPVIENPDFYAQLQQMGQMIPLDFRTMWGMTFIDTIALASTKVTTSSEKWIPLLFHECVHICQYRQLGLQGFMEQYVLGWAQNGFQYGRIPLETHAYSLQAQFEAASRPFSAEASVRGMLRKM